MLGLVFGNPLMLWGLLAAVAPILLHFLRRRRVLIQPWGAMQFLSRAVERQRTRLRFDSTSQLLARTACLVCIALAAADPHWPAAASSRRDPSSVYRLLVIDTSLSMRRRQEGLTAFERAVAEAEKWIALGRIGDTWQIVQHGAGESSAGTAALTYDANALHAELSEMQPGWLPGNLSDSIPEWNALLEHLPAGQVPEVIFLTDLQRAEWEDEKRFSKSAQRLLERLSHRARLVIVDCGSNATEPNLAVTDVSVPAGLVQTQRLVSLVTQIEADDQSPHDVALKALLDGQPFAVRNLRISKSGTAEFSLQFPLPGDHLVELSLPADSLMEDNRNWQGLRSLDHVNILLITGENLSATHLQAETYLTLALDPPREPGESRPPLSRLFNLQRGTVAEGNLVQSQTFDVVILANVPSIPTATADALARFVQGGGGLLLVMGDNVIEESWNRQFGPQGAGLLPARLESDAMSESERDRSVPLHLEINDADHPIVSPFVGHPEAGLETTRIQRHILVDPISDDEQSTTAEPITVLRLSDGSPLLMTQAVGAGQVALVTTALDNEWGDWVLWPSFVPVIHETLRYLATGRTRVVASHNTEILTLPARSLPFSWEARRQDGTTLRGVSDSATFLPGEPPFDIPGAYTVTSEALPNGQFYVIRNLDPSESNLNRMTPQELLEGPLKGLRVEFSTASSRQLDRHRLPERRVALLSMWLTLIALALGLTELLFLRHPRSARRALGVLGAGVILAVLLRPPVFWAMGGLLLLCVWSVTREWGRLSLRRRIV